jgi:hypothetical protein
MNMIKPVAPIPHFLQIIPSGITRMRRIEFDAQVVPLTVNEVPRSFLIDEIVPGAIIGSNVHPFVLAIFHHLSEIFHSG